MDAIGRLARLRREAGAELVEFALVLPLLLFVMVGIFDFGFLFRDYGVITNAAREGARIGVLAGYSTADVQDRVSKYMAAAGLTAPPVPPDVSPFDLPVGGGATVRVVRVTVLYPHRFTLLSPIAALKFGWFDVGGFTDLITLRAVSTMRVEAPGS